MRAETEIELLNTYIDRLQADSSPRLHVTWREEGTREQDGPRDIAMLQMAAALNSMRLGANSPNARFVSQLRARVLAESKPGTNLAR